MINWQSQLTAREVNKPIFYWHFVVGERTLSKSADGCSGKLKMRSNWSQGWLYINEFNLVSYLLFICLWNKSNLVNFPVAGLITSTFSSSVACFKAFWAVCCNFGKFEVSQTLPLPWLTFEILQKKIQQKLLHFHYIEVAADFLKKNRNLPTEAPPRLLSANYLEIWVMPFLCFRKWFDGFGHLDDEL